MSRSVSRMVRGTAEQLVVGLASPLAPIQRTVPSAPESALQSQLGLQSALASHSQSALALALGGGGGWDPAHH